MAFLRRSRMPVELVAALDKGEAVRGFAVAVDGTALAATRIGLWVARDGRADRLGWELVSKARLQGTRLTVVPAEPVGELPDGTEVLRDRGPWSFELTGKSSLTDAVHNRVRRSVAASRQLTWPGAGGWVVLRRVPGRDGLARQVRLDPGADAGAPGFADAVARLAAALEAGSAPAE